MIFTLIRNEIIKILKRPKTWIVFGLFFLCVSGMIFISYREDKSMRHYTTPEGKIENLKSQKEYYENRLKKAKETGGDKEFAEEQIKEIDNKIKKQEERKANGNTEDSWKEDLIDEKEELQNQLKDNTLLEEDKDSINKRIDDINKSLSQNKKPVENWEFNAINFGKGVTDTIGLVILILGIAIFMSDIVSGESTPATLKFLLVQPISRGKVIFAKFIAVTLIVITMIGGSEILAFLGVGAVKGFDGADTLVTVGKSYEWTTIEGSTEKMLNVVKDSGFEVTRGHELLQIFGMQMLFIVACCAFILLISTIFKSSMISMAISLTISVASTMLCMVPSIGKNIAHLIFLNYGSPSKIIEGNISLVFSNTNFSVNFGLALMVGVIVVSYALSHVVFCKKDMLI